MCKFWKCECLYKGLNVTLLFIENYALHGKTIAKSKECLIINYELGEFRNVQWLITVVFYLGVFWEREKTLTIWPITMGHRHVIFLLNPASQNFLKKSLKLLIPTRNSYRSPFVLFLLKLLVYLFKIEIKI